jgi:Tol biopolymer transport system component
LERNLETGKEREIAKDVSLGSGSVNYFAEFALSPDGRRVAFIKEETLENDQTHWTSASLLKVKSLAGGEAVELCRKQGPITLQGWTPDGRYILFQDYERRRKKKDLWRIPATGGAPRKIELTMKEIHHLRVHPDGRQVVFDIKGKKKQELWVLESFLPESTTSK